MTPHAKDTELWISYLKKINPKTYLDIGAGDGYDCAQVKAAFPDCRCIAIEPYEAWEVGDEIEKHRDVIGQANTFGVFYIKETPGIHGIYSRTAVANREVIAKPVRTLLHFRDREAIETIDAMKIDVEGAAFDVLLGAGPILSRLKAVHIETEWLPLFEGQALEPEVFRILASSGLSKVWENRVEELGQGDSIWMRL